MLELKTSGRHIDLNQAKVYVKAAKMNDMSLTYLFLENPTNTFAWKQLSKLARRQGVHIKCLYIFN